MADRSLSALAGKRIVITRAEAQSASLREALHATGAEIVSLPLIRIVPPEYFADLDAALHDLDKFEWLIFTSQNAVSAVANRLNVFKTSGNPSEWRNLSSVRIAAVGKSTADAAKAAGFSVAYTGKGGTATDLVNELAADLSAKRVFLPHSDRASPALAPRLRELGANLTEVIAYRTVPLDAVDTRKRESVARADAILFFSPSAVHAFLDQAKKGALCPITRSIAVGAIGPITFAALAEAGVHCDFQAPEPSVGEIVAVLAMHFEKTKVSSAYGVNSR